MASREVGRQRRHAFVRVTLALLAALLVTGCGRCGVRLEDDLRGDPDESLAHVFIGTVVENTWSASLVEVEEVWFGPDLAPEVWLRSTSIFPDAPLGVGERFVIGIPKGEHLRTGPCFIGFPESGVMQEVEPDRVRDPVVGGVAGDPPPSTWIDGIRPYAFGVFGGFVGLAVAIVVLNRRSSG